MARKTTLSAHGVDAVQYVSSSEPRACTATYITEILSTVNYINRLHECYRNEGTRGRKSENLLRNSIFESDNK